MDKDLRTPLNKAMGLGSAKSGTHHFIQQRVTAVANVFLFIFFIGLVVSLLGKDYASAYQIIATPWVAILFALMLLSGIYHMKLGMQVIIEDYISTHNMRLICLMLNTFFSFAIAALTIWALLKITLGG